MKTVANEGQKHRKRHFLIYPSFQLRYIGWMVVPLLLNLVALYILAHFLLAAIRLQIQSYLVVDGALWKELSEAQDRTILYTFASGALFTTFLLIVGGLAASHRIAGPMMRLRIEFRKLARTRRFDPIRFRKRDLFQEVATDFNAAMKAVIEPESTDDRRPG